MVCGRILLLSYSVALYRNVLNATRCAMSVKSDSGLGQTLFMGCDSGGHSKTAKRRTGRELELSPELLPGLEHLTKLIECLAKLVWLRSAETMGNLKEAGQFFCSILGPRILIVSSILTKPATFM